MSLKFLVIAAAAAASISTPVRQLDWETLLPAKERETYNPNPPPPIHSYLGEGDVAALQTGSYAVNPELNGAHVRIPGFVVPLERKDDGSISEFLLVPYFGACIHVPPPPPNQIVYVKMRVGVSPHSMEDAQWVTGTLHASTKSSALGAAAYTLDGEKIEVYRDTSP
jgi:hypothetical protein